MTITGRYNGVPISIVSIGMGSPNVDFFIREVRAVLDGDMVVIRRVILCLIAFLGRLAYYRKRLGSCGCITDLPVGSVVIPKASVAVNRNYDFDFVAGNYQESPYRISKPARASISRHVADLNVSP